jgi:hypothetical protein
MRNTAKIDCLHIIDSNITQEAKEKGIQLMTQYLGQVFPIMDYEP